jgi:hypothetical protein
MITIVFAASAAASVVDVQDIHADNHGLYKYHDSIYALSSRLSL